MGRRTPVILTLIGLTPLFYSGCSRPLRIPHEHPYFPLAVGNEWTHRVTKDTGNKEYVGFEVTSRIESCVKGPDGFIFKYAESDEGNWINYQHVRSDGIHEEGRLKEGVFGVSTPEAFLLILEKPLIPESKWRTKAYKFTVGPEEILEVPAGRFPAIPVIMKDTDGFTRTTIWYARGVGPIKEEFYSTLDFPVLWVRELAKYKIK